MDAISTDAASDHYAAPAPVLIAATGSAARQRAVRTIEASGLRIADIVEIEQAPERIERQAAASALWVELDCDRGGAMDRLLDSVNRDVRAGRFSAVVAATADLVDPCSARLTDNAVDLLVDATDADRAAALALAVSGVHRAGHLSDIATDRNSARLRQLSDEVGRIASTLARLSSGPATALHEVPPMTHSDTPPDVAPDIVRSVIRARRLRSRFFAEDLFADPAWDMLLDLLQAEIAQLRVPVSSLCIAAAVPATTALRWLKTMTGQGLFVRRADPHDGRRVFVELAPPASLALRRFFVDVGHPAVV
ncbi:MarR family winged helix-turn-helix transcriptional regulator [Sphingomonas sp.]|uniref:MarR family winged helix-turn-helix transcriptional regulator n=1 Tax=Sphingomonas sp. TaxID=28214 RepID=UPI00286DD899|nr:MarR family winged helix-turn-helix transcriptional regulator [Sphingomonas sp.]